MEQFLNGLLMSLNHIEVRGKENMDYLLGAIMAVESTLAQLREPAEEAEENNG